MRSSFSSHVVLAWDLPPAGGGRRGEAEAGEQTGGPVRPVPPSQPVLRHCVGAARFALPPAGGRRWRSSVLQCP